MFVAFFYLFVMRLVWYFVYQSSCTCYTLFFMYAPSSCTMMLYGWFSISFILLCHFVTFWNCLLPPSIHIILVYNMFIINHSDSRTTFIRLSVGQSVAGMTYECHTLSVWRSYDSEYYSCTSVGMTVLWLGMTVVQLSVCISLVQLIVIPTVVRLSIWPSSVDETVIRLSVWGSNVHIFYNNRTYFSHLVKSSYLHVNKCPYSLSIK